MGRKTAKKAEKGTAQSSHHPPAIILPRTTVARRKGRRMRGKMMLPKSGQLGIVTKSWLQNHVGFSAIQSNAEVTKNAKTPQTLRAPRESLRPSSETPLGTRGSAAARTPQGSVDAAIPRWGRLSEPASVGERNSNSKEAGSESQPHLSTNMLASTLRIVRQRSPRPNLFSSPSSSLLFLSTISAFSAVKTCPVWAALDLHSGPRSCRNNGHRGARSSGALRSHSRGARRRVTTLPERSA